MSQSEGVGTCGKGAHERGKKERGWRKRVLNAHTVAPAEEKRHLKGKEEGGGFGPERKAESIPPPVPAKKETEDQDNHAAPRGSIPFSSLRIGGLTGIQYLGRSLGVFFSATRFSFMN